MRTLFLTVIALFFIIGCKDESPVSPTTEIVQYSEINMGCIDIPSFTPLYDSFEPLESFKTIIRNQEEYQNLIYAHFQTPLNNYWNAHYDSMLARVKRNNPGLSDSTYERLVREEFYNYPPFKGTANCTPPTIDFTQFTLLGFAAHAGGCEHPTDTILISKDNKKKELVCKIIIYEHGPCRMLILQNKWIIIPKIANDFTVLIQKEYKQIE